MQDAHLDRFLAYTPKRFATLYSKLLSFHMHILSCANFELSTLSNNNRITWSRRWRSSACKRGNKIHIGIWFWSSKKAHTLTNYFQNWHTNFMEQQYKYVQHIDRNNDFLLLLEIIYIVTDYKFFKPKSTKFRYTWYGVANLPWT